MVLGSPKNFIEGFTVPGAQGMAEFRPAFELLIKNIGKRGDGASHRVLLSQRSARGCFAVR